MKQTLNKRLIRAGLTFIILGTTAAAMPQQSGAVRADDCTLNGHTWTITQTSASIQSGGSVEFTSHYGDTSGVTATPADWTSSPASVLSPTNSSSSASTFTVTGTNSTGNSSATGTVTATKTGDTTYVATATVTVN